MELSDLITISVALVGSGFGAYVGVKVAQTRLEGRVSYLEREVGLSKDEGLRGDRHRHANQIQNLEARTTQLERWRESQERQP